LVVAIEEDYKTDHYESDNEKKNLKDKVYKDALNRTILLKWLLARSEEDSERD